MDILTSSSLCEALKSLARSQIKQSLLQNKHLPFGIVSNKLNPYKSDVTKDEGSAGMFLIL